MDLRASAGRSTSGDKRRQARRKSVDEMAESEGVSLNLYSVFHRKPVRFKEKRVMWSRLDLLKTSRQVLQCDSEFAEGVAVLQRAGQLVQNCSIVKSTEGEGIKR